MTADGRTSPFQVLPPSVVASTPLWPTAVQSDVVEQEMPSSLAVAPGRVSGAQVLPPSVVVKARPVVVPMYAGVV